MKYVTIGSAEAEIIEKKSRFIATAKEIHSEDEAMAFLEDMRKKYWDARHNCFAYVLGKNNEIQRFSDDKEPQGTAGRPILDVLSGSGVCNTIIVVTRYFGGILLGTGGLVRAYSSAASKVLSSMMDRSKEAGTEALSAQNEGYICAICEGMRISLPWKYKDLGRIDSIISDLNIAIFSKDYGEDAVYDMAIPDDCISRFTSAAEDAVSESISLSDGVPVTYYIHDGTANLYDFS